jgi:hypothetical protein
MLVVMSSVLDVSCREALLSDQKRDNSAAAATLRKSSAVISMWDWDSGTKTGTFWLGEEVGQRWKDERWLGTILRLDSWIACANPVFCVDNMEIGERWTEHSVS